MAIEAVSVLSMIVARNSSVKCPSGGIKFLYESRVCLEESKMMACEKSTLPSLSKMTKPPALSELSDASRHRVGFLVGDETIGFVH
jgi:hypothetical protein